MKNEEAKEAEEAEEAEEAKEANGELSLCNRVSACVSVVQNLHAP